MPSKGTRVVYVTQRVAPTELVYVLNPDRVDPLIQELLETRTHEIMRIAVFVPTPYEPRLDLPTYGLTDEELIRQALCGDWPAPCNCDDPETHNGH